VDEVRVSLVIPTLDEERNVAWVLERVPEGVGEIILVDGRSTDDTIAVARSVRPDIRVVEERRPGKGAALRAGFAAARGDIVVMIDADGSMDPAEIDRYVAKLDEGYDVVKGSRFADGGGTTDISCIRAAGNLALLAIINGLFGTRFTDLCYGFFALRRRCVPALGLVADGFEIETEIVVHTLCSGLRMAEVPSFEAPRRNGDSHLRTFRDGSRVLREIWRARRRGSGRVPDMLPIEPVLEPGAMVPMA
jgi:glycosyltransferase involved in cell wall biosynthesis